MILKDRYEEYKGVLPDYTSKLVGPWNSGPSHPGKIGSFMELYRKYNVIKSEDYYHCYIEDRGEQPLLQAAKELSEISGVDLGICQAYVYLEAIIRVTLGGEMEEKARKLIESKGYRAITPTYTEDTEYGIDLKVLYGDSLVSVIQIKPLTFFLGTTPILFKKRREIYHKRIKSTTDLNVPYTVMIYDNYGNWIKNSDKFLFFVEDCIDRNGNNKLKNANYK